MKKRNPRVGEIVQLLEFGDEPNEDVSYFAFVYYECNNTANEPKLRGCKTVTPQTSGLCLITNIPDNGRVCDANKIIELLSTSGNICCVSLQDVYRTFLRR
jgi:hypothetical protein